MYNDIRCLWILNRRVRLSIFFGISFLFSVVLCFLSSIPIGPQYHHFADQRTFFGIPSGFDVLSNVPFLLVGALGIVTVLRAKDRTSFLENRERIPYVIFFSGVLLTGAGSAYYHASPGNFRLVWDLLPMTLAFVSLTDATIMERISINAGLRLLVPLLIAGVTSVMYWYRGSLLGHGDLRFYLFVQFFSPVAIAVMVCLFPPRYTRTMDLCVAFILFVVAKLCELLDKQIYSLGGMVSGHTLKHLIAGLSSFWILRMLWRRSATENATLQGKSEGR
jgi:hypothetical protein